MESTGLYVHVPFCARKCFYCAFYSIPPTSERVRRYLAAVDREAKSTMDTFFPAGAPPLETIYIGGGTPTCLAGDALDTLLTIIRDRFTRTDACEFTVETSPETTTGEKLTVLAGAGANRISLGVQSFNDRLLRQIGRRHTTADTVRALRDIRAAGIDEVNLDLIYSLPQQRLKHWQEDLDRAVDANPPHLACYELTVEPGTPFHDDTHRGDEDLTIDMYYHAKDRLEHAGFEHYEISNYARPGHQSRHNVRYWRNRPYLGLGPAAAGFIDGTRRTNVADLDAYTHRLLEADTLATEITETPRGLHLAGETAMLNLRMIRGIDRHEFKRVTGFDPFDVYADQIDKLRAAGLIDTDEQTIHLSRKGLVLANEVMAEFLP